jgi:hypothetical protein
MAVTLFSNERKVMFYAGSKGNVTREELVDYKVPTHEELRSRKNTSGSRWAPVHHLDLIETIENQASRMGYTIKNESFQTPSPKNPHDLFGFMEFETDIPGFDGQIGQMLGFKSSNLQNHALKIVSGGRVFICMNGMVTGEWVAKHKHTTGLYVPQLVREGLLEWERQQQKTIQTVNSLQETGMNDELASHALVLGAREGIISSDKILSIYREWEDPKHEEFQERNAWSFYNCVTERAKEWRPSRIETAVSRMPNFLLDNYSRN